MQTTFLMVKPDGVQRGLVGEVISRVEERGLRITALKMLTIHKEMASEHYQEHVGKDFYEGLIEYITSGPVVAMAVWGDNAISIVRDMVGETDPNDASPGTIRGDYALNIGRNIVHAADSKESAERELNIFFKDSDYQEYNRVEEDWVYE